MACLSLPHPVFILPTSSHHPPLLCDIYIDQMSNLFNLSLLAICRQQLQVPVPFSHTFVAGPITRSLWTDHTRVILCLLYDGWITYASVGKFFICQCPVSRVFIHKVRHHDVCSVALEREALVPLFLLVGLHLLFIMNFFLHVSNDVSGMVDRNVQAASKVGT